MKATLLEMLKTKPNRTLENTHQEILSDRPQYDCPSNFLTVGVEIQLPFPFYLFFSEQLPNFLSEDIEILS